MCNIVFYFTAIYRESSSAKIEIVDRHSVSCHKFIYGRFQSGDALCIIFTFPLITYSYVYHQFEYIALHFMYQTSNASQCAWCCWLNLGDDNLAPYSTEDKSLNIYISLWSKHTFYRTITQKLNNLVGCNCWKCSNYLVVAHGIQWQHD